MSATPAAPAPSNTTTPHSSTQPVSHDFYQHSDTSRAPTEKAPSPTPTSSAARIPPSPVDLEPPSLGLDSDIPRRDAQSPPLLSSSSIKTSAPQRSPTRASDNASRRSHGLDGATADGHELGGAAGDKKTGEGKHTMPLNKFTLYETRSRFFIVASNQSDQHYRVLKIDRTSDELVVIEDAAVYSERQIQELLRMIEEGNKGSGGLEKVMVFYGIVGFIRFTQGWYMILITKRSVVALLGGHYIYHVDETITMTIQKGGGERSSEETRLLNLFQKVDLSKNFYWSYTYDLTSTLQANLTGVRRPASCTTSNSFHQITDRYMWNYHLLKEAFDLQDQALRSWKGALGGEGESGRGSWLLPMIYGFVDQAKISILGRTIYITLIGRRSRFFAGARYLKRGANEHGHVANEVETEQIASEPVTTPFHCPTPRFAEGGDDGDLKHSNPNYTSYVQYRGSIPLLWTQDPAASNFKPPISISIVDPYFSAAARHFDAMLEKYGGPLIIVNLIKAKEPVARESKLLSEYTQCVDYLNQFLPEGKKMKYIAWDMSRATKNKDHDVIGILEDIADESIQMTKFFHSGRMRREDGSVPYRDRMQLQNGVCRTNCVDCLDRTNAAQFAMGKKALGYQLYALGVIESPDLHFACDAADLLTEMFHDHGDTLALQYSGGALVNRIDTYTRTSQWNSHSRDLIENMKRYYANTLLDAEKQVAINLFLGIDASPSIPLPSLLSSTELLPTQSLVKRGYRDWYDPAHLEDVVDLQTAERRMRVTISQACDFYIDYYRPRLFTSFERHFAARINSTSKFVIKNGNETNFSPFISRKAIHQPSSRRKSINPVKRWITQDRHSLAIPGPSSAPTKKDGGGVTDPTVDEVEPGSIEAKVLSSLAPEVNPEEIEEYLRYSASHEDELFSSHSLGRPIDYDLYQSTVSLQETFLSEETSDPAYKRYCAFDADEVLRAHGPPPSSQLRAFVGGEGWAFGTSASAAAAGGGGSGAGATVRGRKNKRNREPST